MAPSTMATGSCGTASCEMNIYWEDCASISLGTAYNAAPNNPNTITAAAATFFHDNLIDFNATPVDLLIFDKCF